MKTLIALATVLVATLSACSSVPSSEHMELCFRTTAPMSVARFACTSRADRLESEDRASEKRMTQLQGYASKCDTYGFRRGTNQFAQCLQQAERQQSIDDAIETQQYQYDRQRREQLFRQSQCHFSGRTNC